MGAYRELGNRRLKSQCVKGAAANMFQKKAIGKFLITVPTQMAGSWAAGIPAMTTLNRTEATKLMVGHMTATVPAYRMTRQT